MVATDYILKVISLLGGLALFLFGMDIMGKALQKQAGGKLQSVLAKMSSTWFKGLLLGAAVTAVIQSSSATTVMLVGFITDFHQLGKALQGFFHPDDCKEVGNHFLALDIHHKGILAIRTLPEQFKIF